MREIKFRAWDKVEKVWYDWESGALGYTEDHKSRKHGACIIAYFDLMEDFVLSQYTGLKDKNGKEIYEGDILRLHCGSSDGAFEKAKVNAEVVWNRDRFTVEIPDKEVVVKQGIMKGKKVNVRTMHTWVGAHTCLLVWQDNLEIIGNIYENPHLLKNK